jgi:hypothetical protein
MFALKFIPLGTISRKNRGERKLQLYNLLLDMRLEDNVPLQKFLFFILLNLTYELKFITSCLNQPFCLR